ncbi:uncharacterized protein LOC124411421 [Diprion similis]|uniref:uncharacterized protein LOC124411421 n=1 Tax=Diprion similis TaxID=362088 RepID=UPI001EF7BEDA|nr:uncharacterized protein LOC124411421 [Diprion similis]
MVICTNVVIRGNRTQCTNVTCHRQLVTLAKRLIMTTIKVIAPPEIGIHEMQKPIKNDVQIVAVDPKSTIHETRNRKKALRDTTHLKVMHSRNSSNQLRASFVRVNSDRRIKLYTDSVMLIFLSSKDSFLK